MNNQDYMLRCLNLAEKGLGQTLSNPLVGSVLVHNNQIIGAGFHEIYGGPHAEVNAINSVVNQELLKEASLYVNLEPCAHFGKTPPCSHLIVEKKIPKVIVGAIDTFSEVSGKGIEYLRSHGVEVVVGILEKECRQLNRRFYTFHEKKRPYIILKWAQSSDGFMDIERKVGEKNPFWITQPETQKLTHQWRHEEMGILVGRQTVETDDPTLTVRAVGGKNPIRIVLDSKASLSLDYKVFNKESKTIRFSNLKLESKDNIIEIQATGLDVILSHLYEQGIVSLIVEGGAHTLQQFIDANIWDEARILTGISEIKQGLKAPKIEGAKRKYDFGLDQVEIIENHISSNSSPT